MFQKTSFTTLIIGVFIVYVLHTCWVMYGIVYTKPCEDRSGENCITSYMTKNPRLQLSIYTSLKSSSDGNPNLNLILNVDDLDIYSKFERNINVSLPKKTRNNGTLFTYVFVHHAGVLPWKDSKQVHIVTQLTTYMVPKPQEINLISGEETTQMSESQKTITDVPDRPITHWRSRLTLNIMADHFSFDREAVPADVHRYMKLYQYGKTVQYLPILFVDLLSNRVKDLVIVNSSTSELPLTIIYDKISLGKLRFWIHMQDAVYSLQQFGFTEKDADEIKGIFVDTNLYFLALTFFVAAFHLLFDFLAFKNDISFWKKKKSMVGMSSKAVLWRCFSTIVIFLFLLDEQTSLLVLIPAGIGAIIEIWKVKKAFKIIIHWKGIRPTFQSLLFSFIISFQAMKYLSFLLYPLCLGGAVYSLVYLKSVAHLPWKAFMYKAFNTFIDDVFAFIITMPTSHRLACFRDDVVFLIYLYQRWLYPVDKTRINEYGESYDEKSKGKPHRD
uniref:Lipid scramblase CLPTM1L n=1 Tax=Erpetoichthys calabaricus TaxID=27687 RepID=A0A8C4XBF7_ERPCA